MNHVLNVVIFTCEGREHLLGRMYESFAPILRGVPHKRILAVDGTIEPAAVELIAPDVLVQNHRRRGYIHSIINALALVDSEVFLWLEDDWESTGKLDVAGVSAMLHTHRDWLQIRWSKTAPLQPEDVALVPGFHHSSDGFSANPCICRTTLARQGFEYLLQAPKGDSLGVDGFENVLTRWVQERNVVCAVVQPGDTPTVEHLGHLESTGRQWHMTSSVEQKPETHLYNFGKPPSFPRRVWMIYRLLRVLVSLGWQQLWADSAYEFAFRIVMSKVAAKRGAY